MKTTKKVFTASMARNNHGEWEVRFFQKTKFLPNCTYFTDDYEDAKITMIAELKRMEKNIARKEPK